MDNRLLRRIGFNMLMTLFFTNIVSTSFVIDGYALENLNTYQKLAKDAEVIVLGTVDSVEMKKEIFGETGHKPYYVNYQYITINIEKVIKGSTKSNQVIIQSTRAFMDDPKFSQNERVIVMLKWFEDKKYGNYYALLGRAKGKFSVLESTSLGNQVMNDVLMKRGWKMNLDNFILDITITE